MSMSKTKTVSGPAVRADSDAPSVNAGQAGRGPARPVSIKTPRGPEWKTERWKLQVEAEARNRLKNSIRDVGNER
jgi:hypothetical protein